MLDGLTNPARLQLHDGYLYFTEMGPFDVLNSRLARISPTGVLETLLMGQDIAGMYLDEDELFVSERGTRKVFRMPYATLTPELFHESDLKVADMERIGERIWMTFFNDETPRSIAVYGLDRTTKERSESLPLPRCKTHLTYLRRCRDNLYLSTFRSTIRPATSASTSAGPTKVGLPSRHLGHPHLHRRELLYFTTDHGRIFAKLTRPTISPRSRHGPGRPYHVQVGRTESTGATRRTATPRTRGPARSRRYRSAAAPVPSPRTRRVPAR